MSEPLIDLGPIFEDGSLSKQTQLRAEAAEKGILDVWVVDRFTDRIRKMPNSKAERESARQDERVRGHIFCSEIDAYRFMDKRAADLTHKAID